jgi:lysophospholipase L1-like esterase
MKFLAPLLFPVFLLAQTNPPQANPLLNANDANQLVLRISQVMESTASVVPGLVKTSSIVSENAKQNVADLKATPNSSPLTEEFLNHARAYLALTDAMPKPYPMPETARKQFIELREDIERLEIHFHALLEQKERQLRAPDRDNLQRYADANTKLNAPAPNSTRVVFMGDSITDFWRLNEYFTGREYINRGISGQITGEMLGRMKADVIDLHPKAMLILAGTNDLARGVSISTIENNLSMIGDLCAAHGIKPVYSAILPVSDYHKAENPTYERTKTRPPAAIVELNNWIREYCQAHNYVYVDYYNALKDTNGVLGADEAEDGLHPNAKGYRIMAPLAIKGLDQALAENSPKEQPSDKKKRALPFTK